MKFISEIYFRLLKKNSKSIVCIPSVIEKLPTGAVNNKYVKKIYIPSTVSVIEMEAFYGCDSLSDVYFCGFVRHIDKNAFSLCKNVRFHLARSLTPDERRAMTVALHSFSKNEKTSLEETVTEQADTLTCEGSAAEESDAAFAETETAEIIAEEADIAPLEELADSVSAPTANEIPETTAAELSSENIRETSQNDEQPPEPAAEPSPESEVISEVFDALVLPEISAKTTSAEKAPRKKRKTEKIDKASARERDVKKYKTANSVCDIVSNDPFTALLIKKYSDLLNEYGYSTPIGFIDLTKDEYEILTERVKELVENESSITSLNAFFGALFLVKTVSNYDHQNNFWRTVSTLLKIDEYTATEYLKKCLLMFCSSEKLYFRYTQSGRSYSGTALVHSVMNRSIQQSTIDFAYDFYIEEMIETYDPLKITKQVELFVSEFIADIGEETGGELDGIYKLSYFFKTACLEFPEAMKEAMKCLLFNIDAYYHNNSNVNYSPVVIHKFFKRWKIQKTLLSHKTKDIADVKSKQRKRKSVVHENTERLSQFSRCAYFLTPDRKLFLFVPEQDIPKEYSASEIKINLYDDNVLIGEYSRECSVFGVFRFRSEKTEIGLKKFYKNLSVRFVTENGTVIYDTKSQLNRKYVVFDEKLDEYMGRSVPLGRFYIMHKKEDRFFADADYSSYPAADHIIESLEVERDTDILVNNENVFRSTLMFEDILLKVSSEYRVRSACAIKGGVEYGIYTKLPEINISVNCSDPENYILDICGSHVSADELKDISLKELISGKLPFVEIALRQKGSKKVLSERNFVVLERFEYCLDKDFYYAEKSAQLLDIYADDVDFFIEDYPYECPLNKTRTLSVNCSLSSFDFYISIALPMLYWELDDKLNSLTGAKYIKAEQLRNSPSLTLHIPDRAAAVFAANESVVRELTIENGKCSLTDLAESSCDSTVVGVHSSICKDITLFEIIYAPVIRELSVNCDEKILSVSMVRIGEGTAEISLTDENGTELFSRRYDFSGDGKFEYSEDISDVPDGIYTAAVSLVIADEFGFSEERKDCGKIKITKGNAFELYCRDKKFIIQPEYCYMDGKKNRVCNFYCDDIRSSDNEESGIYTANAFFMKKGVPVYIRNANPVAIELIEKKNDCITFALMDNQRDGFIYEKARGYLQYDEKGLRDDLNYDFPDYYSIRI